MLHHNVHNSFLHIFAGFTDMSWTPSGAFSMVGPWYKIHFCSSCHCFLCNCITHFSRMIGYISNWINSLSCRTSSDNNCFPSKIFFLSNMLLIYDSITSGSAILPIPISPQANLPLPGSKIYNLMLLIVQYLIVILIFYILQFIAEQTLQVL